MKTKTIKDENQTCFLRQALSVELRRRSGRKSSFSVDRRRMTKKRTMTSARIEIEIKPRLSFLKFDQIRDENRQKKVDCLTKKATKKRFDVRSSFCSQYWCLSAENDTHKRTIRRCIGNLRTDRAASHRIFSRLKTFIFLVVRNFSLKDELDIVFFGSIILTTNGETMLSKFSKPDRSIAASFPKSIIGNSFRQKKKLLVAPKIYFCF